MSIAKDNSVDWWRGSRQLFQRCDTRYGDRACPASVDVERVIFRMRLLPRRIHPSNALRDQAINSRSKHRGHQVLGSLTAHASVSLRSFSHLAGIETGWQICELMDHYIWISL
jgi:hypothetical protein